MMADFEKEFDKIQKAQDDAMAGCSMDGMSGCADIDDVLGTYEEVIRNTIMPPSKSGIYFSRLDLKKLAHFFGESIVIDERKKMIKKLLEYVDSHDALIRFESVVNDAIDTKITIYENLKENFPSSAYQFDEYISKARSAQKDLKRSVEEY